MNIPLMLDVTEMSGFLVVFLIFAHHHCRSNTEFSEINVFLQVRQSIRV